MKTHRCKGSLVAHIPIRYTMRFQWLKYTGDMEAWRLFTPRNDDEAMECIHLDHVAVIVYCPFCGEKLPEVEE